MAKRVRPANRRSLAGKLMAPLYLPTVLSGAKSFTNNPIIGSPLLNRLGLHTGRILLASGMAELRRGPLSFTLSAEDKATFRRDGFLVKREFLARDEFQRLEEEVRGYRAFGWECHQGDTITHRLHLDHEALQQLPATRAFLQHPIYRGALAWAGAHAGSPIFHIQRIFNHVTDGPPDPQRHLHTDTFHPTVKSWFFLDDVDERKGPFTYAPGSHRLTRARLVAQYRRSLEARSDPIRYSARGSLRWQEEQLAALGLPPPKRLTVPRNTLVIADTSGIHRRGDATDSGARLEIWSFSRPSPFLPVTPPDIAPLTRLRDRAYRAWLEWQDARARRYGRLPSWRPVGPKRVEELVQIARRIDPGGHSPHPTG